MARPLWKELRSARRQRPLVPIENAGAAPLAARPHYGLALVSFAIAIAALALDQTEGGTLAGHLLHKHVWAGATAAAFVVFGSIAVRRFAGQVGRLVHVGGGPTAGAALRLILTITGLILVLIVTIGMLGVSATKLLAAAGITGIIIGLAAQQSLGNVFAGIVLMVARPFVVGQRIRIRSGSYGGIFDGEVRGMGLTYVELLTDDGPVFIPNLGMLAAGVGPAPKANEDGAIPPGGTGHQGAHGSHLARRVHRDPTPRRPRELIRRMRGRHPDGDDQDGSTAGEGPPEPPSE